MLVLIGKVAVSWLKIGNPNPTILSHETATLHVNINIKILLLILIF